MALWAAAQDREQRSCSVLNWRRGGDITFDHPFEARMGGARGGAGSCPPHRPPSRKYVPWSYLGKHRPQVPCPSYPTTKNGEQVVVPLNSAAMSALAVFGSRGDGTGRVVRNAVGETLNVNAHWFVPAVRQAGVPLGNIAELLGHKGLAMSRRYAHLCISNLPEAVSRIANGTPVAPEPREETRANGYLN